MTSLGFGIEALSGRLGADIKRDPNLLPRRAGITGKLTERSNLLVNFPSSVCRDHQLSKKPGGCDLVVGGVLQPLQLLVAIYDAVAACLVPAARKYGRNIGGGPDRRSQRGRIGTRAAFGSCFARHRDDVTGRVVNIHAP